MTGHSTRTQALQHASQRESRSMHMILTIQESTKGLWCICSGSAVLFDQLSFAHAIRLARGLAREEHANSGRTICVEMASPEFTIALAQYAGTVALRCVAA
jgi:hypothetical protein